MHRASRGGDGDSGKASRRLGPGSIPRAASWVGENIAESWTAGQDAPDADALLYPLMARDKRELRAIGRGCCVHRAPCAVHGAMHIEVGRACLCRQMAIGSASLEPAMRDEVDDGLMALGACHVEAHPSTLGSTEQAGDRLAGGGGSASAACAAGVRGVEERTQRRPGGQWAQACD